MCLQPKKWLWNTQDVQEYSRCHYSAGEQNMGLSWTEYIVAHRGSAKGVGAWIAFKIENGWNLEGLKQNEKDKNLTL